MTATSLFQTFLLPPLLALLTYLLSSYVLYPIYLRLRSHYHPSWTSTLSDRIPSVSHFLLHGSRLRRGSAASSNGASLLGDEELEEGLTMGDGDDDDGGGGRGRRRGDGGPEEQGRVSRELERGFKDESESEEEIDAIVRGRPPGR